MEGVVLQVTKARYLMSVKTEISYIPTMSFWQFACNIIELIIHSDSCC